jgi:hypothetical protein
MQRTMRPWNRIVFLAGLVAFAPVLAGCADFDIDKLDVFHLNDKKPIPGERKPVFPSGVPGVTQGIPPEYLHPNQPPQDAALATPPVQESNNPPEPAPAPAPAPAAAAAAAPPNASRTASVEPHNICRNPTRRSISRSPSRKPPKSRSRNRRRSPCARSPSNKLGRLHRPSLSNSRKRRGPITARPPTIPPGRRRHPRAISSTEARRSCAGARPRA